MSTPSDRLRQSDRISLRMPVEVAWATAQGATFSQTVETLLVSRNGGVLRFTEKLEDGQELHLRRHIEGEQWKHTRARVVAEIDQDANGFLYAIHILEPRCDFWDIEFPSLHKAEEALARLLMECSFRQRREVVYLNEMQLKSFEVRRCVARHCRHCESPSIWIESLSAAAGLEGDGTGQPISSRRATIRFRRVPKTSWNFSFRLNQGLPLYLRPRRSFFRQENFGFHYTVRDSAGDSPVARRGTLSHEAGHLQPAKPR